MYGLFLKHRVKPGHRNQLEAIWKKHMAPAIDANDGHLAYAYSFGADSDSVYAFQIYRDFEQSQAFLQSPAYLEYLAESRQFLEGEPEIVPLEPRWVKGFG